MASSTRLEPGEWSSSTSATGSFTATPGAKIAHATSIASAGNHVTIARSHGCVRRYASSRMNAPRTPAKNTPSAPRDEDGHAGPQARDLLRGTRAHLEGL